MKLVTFKLVRPPGFDGQYVMINPGYVAALFEETHPYQNGKRATHIHLASNLTYLVDSGMTDVRSALLGTLS